jgi:hypothetical protein
MTPSLRHLVNQWAAFCFSLPLHSTWLISLVFHECPCLNRALRVRWLWIVRHISRASNEYWKEMSISASEGLWSRKGWRTPILVHVDERMSMAWSARWGNSLVVASKVTKWHSRTLNSLFYLKVDLKDKQSNWLCTARSQVNVMTTKV